MLVPVAKKAAPNDFPILVSGGVKLESLKTQKMC